MKSNVTHICKLRTIKEKKYKAVNKILTSLTNEKYYKHVSH
jgi:hypothetical protein